MVKDLGALVQKLSDVLQHGNDPSGIVTSSVRRNIESWGYEAMDPHGNDYRGHAYTYIRENGDVFDIAVLMKGGLYYMEASDEVTAKKFTERLWALEMNQFDGPSNGRTLRYIGVSAASAIGAGILVGYNSGLPTLGLIAGIVGGGATAIACIKMKAKHQENVERELNDLYKPNMLTAAEALKKITAPVAERAE